MDIQEVRLMMNMVHVAADVAIYFRQPRCMWVTTYVGTKYRPVNDWVKQYYCLHGPLIPRRPHELPVPRRWYFGGNLYV